MKHTLLIAFLFLVAFNLSAQTTYTGTVDKYPIELVTNIYSDGAATAFYVYTKFDDPVRLDGKLKNSTLTLKERDSAGKGNATFVFKNFDGSSANIEGTWKDKKTNKELKVALAKSFSVDRDNAGKKELLQAASLKDKYFKVVLGKGENGLANVTAIKIFEKKTDKFLQEIKVDCQLMDFSNISVDDYNFDGTMDFSTFENGYAGPNTSSLYFLFNPKTGKFFKSSFEGISLDFDQKTKRIHEHNQCCAGTSYMDAQYKVVNNKMVLVKKECMQLNEKTNKYKKIKCD